MENLIIEKTLTSPRIEFQTDGNFRIEGRSLPENAHKLFEPVYNWMNSFKSDKVKFTVHLDYLNTSSSLELFTFLKRLNANTNISDIKVIWHYEEDDEDHLETGLTYADQLQRIRFEYKKEAA
ncbi:MAG: DUF1987 domain-containing protein [Bacteroidales bacterium]|nr:DUF1987 domain-containing protein [Bacteroidales bacterium]